ncbi:MAG: DNA polymerase I [Akkermansiaceae bacterium]|nr:DNA polymerase I [Akkermansiaceae bacterium]
MPSQRLYLLDGMALAYRAHFALIRTPIYSSGGVNTSALFGFTNTVLTILENEKPTHLAVAFDTSAPTARHTLYPEYKAQRDAMPEDLAAALPNLKRFCQAFHIPVLELDGFEADDIIGTLAKKAEAGGDTETFMVTPDKDFAQLIDTNTYMWKPGRRGSDHDVIDLERMREIWSIERPEQVIDILGLMGDASDNIPGVPGVGEKTAKKLLAEYDSIEKLYENTDKLKGKLKEKVEANKEQAFLSRQLATIILDVPVPQTIDDLVVKPFDRDAVKSLFTEFEFNALGKRLLGDEFIAGRGKNVSEVTSDDGEGTVLESQLKTLADVPHTYHLADSPADRKKLAALLEKQNSFCFDIETTSLNRFEAKMLGIAFSWTSGEAWYATTPDAEALDIFRPALTGSAEKIGHNLKYDTAVLLNQGLKVTGPFFDTLLAHILLHADQRHTMDYLAESMLGYSPVKLSDIVTNKDEEGDPDDLFAHAAKKSKDLDMTAIPLEQLAEYAAEDADVTFKLANLLRPELEKAGQHRVFYDIEAPLLPVLVAMEHEGITLDLGILKHSGDELQKRIIELSTSITKQAGHEFNLNSPKQLGEILFGEMKLVEKPKKTKTGQFKTDESTLASLAPKHPIVAGILEYREASKLKSTYIDALPNHVVKKTGRVHTHFHQLVAATGRLASSDPNLQNIPVRSANGREIRKAFVPRGKEFTLFAADYSQVELRIMAAMSGDAGMIEAFQQDLDIHTATAAKVYGVALDEVKSDMRRTAKMVNFGIIFGISAFGLSQRLGIPRAEAAEIIDTYFAQYPGVKEFMDKTIEEAKANDYVETLTQRRRYLRDINSSNQNIRGNAERAAINTPIQGSAADMIKLAMIKVDQILAEQNAKTRMLLQVHDELVFDLHNDEAETLKPLLVNAMQSALILPNNVPVKVDTGTGANWLEAH